MLVIFFLIVSCNSLQMNRQTSGLNAQTSSHRDNNLQHDPIEDEPKYRHIFETNNAEVRDILKDHPMRNHRRGVHIFWNTKKKLPKEKYGIDWRSPAEMNPYIIFD